MKKFTDKLLIPSNEKQNKKYFGHSMNLVMKGRDTGRLMIRKKKSTIHAKVNRKYEFPISNSKVHLATNFPI